MSNAIIWSTLKVEKSTQEAYGNRLLQAVSFRTDMTDTSELACRIETAIKTRFPFNPTFCTNQHSNVTVDLAAGVARWETYHSIGD